MSAAEIWAISFPVLIGVLYLVTVFRFPRQVGDFIARVRHVRVSRRGIELLTAAIEDKEQRRPSTDSAEELFTGLPDRGRILWVDNHPDWNAREAEALRERGIIVDFVRSNGEAIEQLQRRTGYGMVISDIARDDSNGGSGLDLPSEALEAKCHLPRLMYYVGTAEHPSTADGYAVVDVPSELFRVIGGLL
jgi:CheY-like chemotaxis protein